MRKETRDNSQTAKPCVMPSQLIITNGDSTVELMRAAGFTEEILPWRDVLHDGPVPDLGVTDLARTRAGFLTRFGNVSAATIEADMALRDERIAETSSDETVTLWFEQDLYDQLQLVQILARFADRPAPARLHLVQADTCLSGYTPETIADLRTIARPVTREDLDYARRIWVDFTGDAPSALNRHFGACAPLRYVPPALLRLAREFPHRDTGLTLTQTRALQCLQQAPELAGRLFGKVVEQEEAQFMGDLSFAACLDDLAFARMPLIEGLPGPLLGHPDAYQTYFSSGLAATGAGRDVLDGTANHIRLNGIDRWMGGAHLTPDALWVWDGERLVEDGGIQEK